MTLGGGTYNGTSDGANSKIAEDDDLLYSNFSSIIEDCIEDCWFLIFHGEFILILHKLTTEQLQSILTYNFHFFSLSVFSL